MDMTSSNRIIDRSNLVLAALASGGEGTRVNAVQLLNLMLLIDREIADDIGGPHFTFEPYPYGPYDAAVLETVESLASNGHVYIDESGPCWMCLTTEVGFGVGQEQLAGLPQSAARFVSAAKWVLEQSFRSLLSGIYERYPDMAVKSKIPLRALRPARHSTRKRLHPFLRGMAQSVGILRRPGESDFKDPDPIASDWRAVGDDLSYAMEQVSPDLGAG